MIGQTHRRTAVLAALLVTPLLFLGCDSDSDDIPFFGGSTPTFSGSDQVTSPGGTLAQPLQIVVTNDDGPVADVRVQWSTVDGSLSGDTRTDSSGIANATWTLGDGTQRRYTTASGGIVGGAFVNFVAFVVPADDVVVLVQDNAFIPSLIEVLPGTWVTWIWPTTATNHNVESVGGSVLPSRSGDPVDGPHLFSQEIFFSGLFNYQCVSHGSQGTISAGP